MTNKATVLISENILQATADAIRNKGGASGSIKPTDFAETIKAIATGGLDTSDATATAGEIFQGKTAYAQGRKLTGTFTIDEELNTQDDLIAQIATALEGKAAGGGQATPEISVSSNGLITATAGVKSSTYQMAFQPAKTIIPSAVSQVAVSSGCYTGGDITVAGDSNLVAGNIKSGISIFGVSGTAEVGGETVVDDVSRAIINGTITEISDDEVRIIKPYTFYSCSSLTTANFPACTSIGSFAFYFCSKLTAANFPACTSIGSSAFYSCSKLATASFPECTSIGSYAFNYCSRLTSVNFPAVITISDNAFANCYSLLTVNFPAVTTIGSYAFNYCSRLTSVNFPAVTRIGNNAFYRCSRLTSVSFPAATTIGSYAFGYCHLLSSIQLGVSSVCKLSHSRAFSSTPFAGYSSYFSGIPHIYVPASLITAYQSATNWTYFSSYFSAIESLEE